MTFPARSKYHAKPKTVDGVRFASLSEARRYGELKLLLKAGEIRDLELQPSFQLDVNGVKVGRYVGDFRYTTSHGAVVVEDVKGVQTKMFRRSAKHVQAQYGITIQVVR